MNSIVLELSALEDKAIDNTGMYSLEIHKKISEILEIENKKELRVSNIFGEFFNDTATTEIYTLSLHDALPIYCV